MARFQVKFIASGFEVTDRTLTQKQFEEIDVVAPRDLRWYRGKPEIIEDPDETLLEYFKEHSDEFRVKELGDSPDVKAEKAAPKPK